MSSVHNGVYFPVEYAIDGIHNNMMHTSNDNNPTWLRLDMQTTQTVGRVDVYNRRHNTRTRLDG